MALGNAPDPLLSLYSSVPLHHTVSQGPSVSHSDALSMVPPASLCQALGSGYRLASLPPRPLIQRFPRRAKLADGRVGFPVGDSCPREAADTSTSHGSHPATMAEEKRMDRLCVLRHIDFEDFAEDLWPACQPAAHFSQGASTCHIQIPVNIMCWSFHFVEHCSAKTAKVPSQINKIKSNKTFQFQFKKYS